jgi:hypothetical protein
MNANLVSIIKRIIAEQGEAILGDPARLKGFVADYGAAESKVERLAFGRCIEYGAYNELKNAADRAAAKAVLARRVNANAGLDLALCNGALDALEMALFGAVALPRQGGYRPQTASPGYTPPSAPSSTPRYQSPAYQPPQRQAPGQAPPPYQQGSQQPVYVYHQHVHQNNSPPPGVRTGGLWVAVLVCNIIGLNWISRFITGHVGTGILVLLLDIVTAATLPLGVGIIPGIACLIIWIADLVKIGTKKWQMADGTFLAP